MRDHIYPIFFTNRTCVHCGAKDSVRLINKFDNEDEKDLYPISVMRCSKCGREYMIMWDADDENNFSNPVAISKNYLDMFTRVLQDSVNSSK